MFRDIYYKILCCYYAYRDGYGSMCNISRGCLSCSNSDVNGVCQCCKDKGENETACPYFRYLAR